MSKPSKRKFVVWLHNMTDRRDDEWVSVYAENKDAAKERVRIERKYEHNRFCLGQVYTAKEFKRYTGLSAN